MILPKVEFSYNNFENRNTGRSPFQIAYGDSPLTTPELWKMEQGGRTSVEAKDFDEHVNDLHEKVCEHITKMNIQYKATKDQKSKHKEFQVVD